MTPNDPVKSSRGPAKPGELPFTQIDRYKLEVFLGAGAMGQVYRAIHTVTQRRSALKLLPDELSQQPGFVARFHAEAQTLARLNHPNIVQIYTGGESDGRLFLDMELIDGGDLQKRITDYTTVTGKGLPEEEARRVIDEILAALECAHREGVIHRDLKPANILLQKNGTVKVSDFGLSAVAGQDFNRSLLKESMSLTKVTSMETIVDSSGGSSSSFAGTILYMSPQALRGENPDRRDDLFSVGVIAYYLIAGKTPAVNYTPVSKVRPELGKDWDRFIATCLAEERPDRYQDAGAARVGLPKLRRGKSAGLLVAAGLGFVALAGATVFFWPKETPPAAAPATATGTTPVVAPPPAPTPHAPAAPQPQSIVFEAVADRPSTAAPFSLLASASSGLPVTFVVANGPATLNGATLTLTGSGMVTVRAMQEGSRAFEPAPLVERTFRVLEPPPPVQKPQSIVFEPIPDRMLGDPPIELAASASSGLPVAFTLVSGPGTLSGTRVTATGVGVITIRCDQSGDGANLAAPSIERAYEIKDPIPESLAVTLAPGVEMVFRRVPAGSLALGPQPGEIGARAGETSRPYSLSEGFLMSATEVTQEQYQAVMGTNPSHERKNSRKFPVEQVRLIDLLGGGSAGPGFVAKFNAALRDRGVTGWVALLPSEDEWEYACRAGMLTPFNNNRPLLQSITDTNVTPVAWYRKSSPQEVAKLLPNSWGLHDMHGNIAEWTRDGVLKGGSFRDNAVDCRAAARLRGQAEEISRDKRFGFRILLQRTGPR